MRFSEAFGIVRTKGDDWYDPHLTVDTTLFVDPLLLLVTKKRAWRGAHDDLIEHFVNCYTLVAKSTGPTSVSANAARRLLTFPEPQEFCLGYTVSGTRGSGSGEGIANQMMDGIAVAIAAGLEKPEHIEEIGILNMGIGADRISDAVCNVLKHRFITYTQAVAKRHGVPVETHRLRHAAVVASAGRWRDLAVKLPTNPANGKPVLLAPRAFLNELPILNADDWFDSGLNNDIRTQMNLTVGAAVRKQDIVDWARRHPERVRKWAREQRSRDDLSGYDFQNDRRNVVRWDGPPTAFAVANPITTLAAVASQAELHALIEQMLNQFKHFIEDQRGWSLLWNTDGTEKPEEAAQLVFLGLAQHYLRQFNVELDREVEMGRGPVDIKVSSGSRFRLIVEVKKANNGKFWNGLEAQLPIYLQGDDCDDGWFVAVRYRSTKASDKRMRELPKRVRKTSAEVGKTLRYAAIDGRPKESASKAKRS
jgi:hypothetical protein